jgi:hypothetical protein
MKVNLQNNAVSTKQNYNMNKSNPILRNTLNDSVSFSGNPVTRPSFSKSLKTGVRTALVAFTAFAGSIAAIGCSHHHSNPLAPIEPVSPSAQQLGDTLNADFIPFANAKAQAQPPLLKKVITDLDTIGKYVNSNRVTLADVGVAWENAAQASYDDTMTRGFADVAYKGDSLFRLIDTSANPAPLISQNDSNFTHSLDTILTEFGVLTDSSKSVAKKVMAATPDISVDVASIARLLKK